ncbi:hypothetical protein [Acidianus sp. HS-5]|uniref:hypothetical protein n=1 Tax=Acidianus sp. HS-5 TaxID=2886040 RepID=UPI001F21D927|nr:hypothetical protein [Acidianus sp. HS-5]BDC17888.1 hypothetical protein HS5_07780 [Acidianus sp. HS-5]
MKRYTFYMSEDIRRQVYREALRYLSPEQVRQIVGEQKKTEFWKNRSKVSDEAVEKLLENLPAQVKLEILTVIEKDLKEALDSIEKEKKELEK